MSSANTVLQVLFELVRIESAKLVEQQRLFLSPNANQLGHFLMEGHSAQEVLEPGIDRQPAILIKGHVFTALWFPAKRFLYHCILSWRGLRNKRESQSARLLLRWNSNAGTPAGVEATRARILHEFFRHQPIIRSHLGLFDVRPLFPGNCSDRKAGTAVLFNGLNIN